MTRRRHRLACTCFAAASLCAPAVFAQVRLGKEFQVNVYTTGAQQRHSIGMDSDGDFVVVWQSFSGQDGEGYGVFGRRYSSTGVALGGEFQISTYTSNNQKLPAVAMDADGDFVAAWQSVQDGFADGIFAQRYSSAGAPVGIEFQVNAYTLFHQDFASVAAEANGDFVVAWSSNYEDGGTWGVFGRRFSSNGTPLAGDFQINAYTFFDQKYPSIAVDADGDFVVVWESRFQDDGASYGVFGRLYSSAGTPVTGEFQISTYTTGGQRFPAVAMSTDGAFLATWHSGQDGDGDGVFARRYSSAGVALASEFQVNTYTTSVQRYPAVAADGAGDFTLVWNSNNQDGNSLGVFGRRFSSAGAAIGGEFQVNTYTTAYQRHQLVKAETDGHFVVAWSSGSQDGTAEGVFAQRFSLGAVLDVDGNGSLGALTDGLLVLRYRFGFTGSVLTTGAVGGGCSRCDAAAIEPYLAGLDAMLDIDGNGSLGALTDGLLVLRFMFGFTGGVLTGGAVGGGCTRCDAIAIQDYLTELTS